MSGVQPAGSSARHGPSSRPHGNEYASVGIQFRFAQGGSLGEAENRATDSVFEVSLTETLSDLVSLCDW